ncbi:MAG: hypothetical protein U0525_02315 [Patescibacteria group bacterium]
MVESGAKIVADTAVNTGKDVVVNTALKTAATRVSAEGLNAAVQTGEKTVANAAEGAGSGIKSAAADKASEAITGGPENVAGAVDDIASGKVAQAGGGPEIQGDAKSIETNNEPTTEIARIKESYDNNLKQELVQANKKAQEAFAEKYPDVKFENGLPNDPAKIAEYNSIYLKNSSEARSNALRTTTVQEYMREHPQPDPYKEPVEFDNWQQELGEQLDALKDAEAEYTNIINGGEKVTERQKENNASDKDTSKAEGQRTKEGEESKEKDEDKSASWGNAFRLAKEVLTVSDSKEEERASKMKDLENKINEIDAANEKSKPRFKTKVTAMKVLIVAGGLGIMLGATAVATEATKAVSQVNK